MENQNNPAYLGDGVIRQPPLPIEAHNQVQVENQLQNALRMHPPAPRPHDYYRGNINIDDCDGPLVLPHFPPGQTFVVMSSLMKMLIARGLFLELPLEDPYAYIAKLRSVCKSCMGRQTWI